MTGKQVCDDYITYLETEERAGKTIVKYRGVFNPFVSFLDRNRVTKLAQVTAGHFDRSRAEQKETKHQKTIYCESVILKQLFKWARSQKLIADNPLVDTNSTSHPSNRSRARV